MITQMQIYRKYKRNVCRMRIKVFKIRRFLRENDRNLILKHYAKEKINALSKYSRNPEECVIGSKKFRIEFTKAKLLELKSNVFEYLSEDKGRLKPADVFLLEIFRRELRTLGWTPEPIDAAKLWLKKSEKL